MSKTTGGTALITGASGGIGAVYADKLARRGYDLIIVARNSERLKANAERIKTETGRTVDVIVADLTKDADIAAVENRLAQDASITILVNNAGISFESGLLDSGPDAIDHVIKLNVTTPTRLSVAAGKAFASRKSGKIINIASVLAFLPEMFGGVYSATKSYVLNLTQALAAQLKETGVQVQAVLPGPVRTDFWTNIGMDPDAVMPGSVMSPEDLVDAALVGLDKGEVVTIPPLADESLFTAFEAARFGMAPHLAAKDIASRYKAA